MIRLIGFIVGLGFTVAVLWAFATGAYTAATEPATPTAEHEFHLHPKELALASDGPFGTWDLQQLQRGYQVYKEVNNAVPPDLSLMTKARHDGSAYVYSLLTGYREQPAELVERFPDARTGTGQYYNPYFANLNIAMAPPLSEGQVTFADGTPATVDQMAKDVAAFLTWTAEPTLVKRTQTGWAVLGFLLFATVLAYMAKQQVWAPVKPKRREKA